MAKASDYFKTILFIIIILQFAPMVLINLKRQYTDLLEPHTKVGMITFSGMITDASVPTKTLKKFFKDPEIKAIVLYFKNGIGGVAGSAQAIFNEIKQLKIEHIKFVGAFVENSCASAAYYVAVSADAIVATPSAFVGSIGVYIPQPHFKEFIEQFKINYTVTKTGDYKTAGDPFLAQTPQQEAMLQALTNDTYDQFIHDVAKSRPVLSLAKSAEWANGKVFTGRQALALGLVDQLGSLTTLEQLLRQNAAVHGRIEWIRPPQPSAFSKLFGAGDDAGDGHLESAMSHLMNYVRTCFTPVM